MLSGKKITSALSFSCHTPPALWFLSWQETHSGFQESDADSFAEGNDLLPWIYLNESMQESLFTWMSSLGLPFAVSLEDCSDLPMAWQLAALCRDWSKRSHFGRLLSWPNVESYSLWHRPALFSTVKRSHSGVWISGKYRSGHLEGSLSCFTLVYTS